MPFRQRYEAFFFLAALAVLHLKTMPLMPMAMWCGPRDDRAERHGAQASEAIDDVLAESTTDERATLCGPSSSPY